jgi:hypothetical protein
VLVDSWQMQEVKNEAHFRQMNERIAFTNDESPVRQLTEVYICECGDAACSDPISLTRVEYEAVRSEATQFAIATDHENPEIDRIVAEHERYTVVEKWLGPALRIVHETDPRR